MAKVTITFEDTAEGVEMKMESDPPFENEITTQSEYEKLTDGQQMAFRMSQILTEEFASREHHGHVHDENCNHG
jgi:hypothetical protein